MALRILTDEEIQTVSMKLAVDCMADAFRQHAAGNLVAPGRLTSDVNIGQLVFTVGATTAPHRVVGFRCYDFQQLSSPRRAELTVLLDADDGHLLGIVTGPLLGALRTGAIGGVAIDHLARRDTETLGLIGAGYQARTQLAAALAVRSFNTVRVFSRDQQKRQQFTDQMRSQFDCDIQEVETARHAAEEADVLICATTSSHPVIEARWLKPGVHINTIGPKFKGSHEVGLDVAGLATRLVTDSSAQLEADGETLLLHGMPQLDCVEDLSTIVASQGGGTGDHRLATDTTLFISLGLAGTEVFLAKRLMDSMEDGLQ
ncbi:MAG: ornithine cyclodeaminase [Planctomycetaceae bacterium]|nr:ornithine cyclodeaminase [Planctomycetaceae bacterium]